MANQYEEMLQEVLEQNTLEAEIFDFGQTHGTAAAALEFRHILDSETDTRIVSKEQKLSDLEDLLKLFREEMGKCLPDKFELIQVMKQLLGSMANMSEDIDAIVRETNEKNDNVEETFAGSDRWARGEALVKFLKDNRRRLTKAQVFFFNEKTKKDRKTNRISFAHFVCSKIILEREMFLRTGNPEYEAGYWRFMTMFRDEDVESRINGTSRFIPFHDQDVEDDEEPEELRLTSGLSLREDELVEAIDMRRKAQAVAERRGIPVAEICRTWIE